MKDYKTPLGFDYENPKRECWTSIEVLTLLKGKPWNQITLNYVHALRPTQIRVVEHDGALKCNACIWRVTVVLMPKKKGSIFLPDEVDYIERIEQEVVAGADGIEGGSGASLDHALRLLPCLEWSDEDNKK